MAAFMAPLWTAGGHGTVRATVTGL
jgi:hypothetical protein